MNVTLSKIIANPQICGDAGQTVTVDDDLGQALIAAGDAVRAGPEVRERETAAIDPAQIEADERAAALRKIQEDAAKKTPAAIKAALDELAWRDDDDWTASGKPAMDRMKALTGAADLTRAEIDAAFPGFVRPIEVAEPAAVAAPQTQPARESGARSSAP